MVLAYHVIFGMYGFWLPNDPRGSWSQFVGSWDLYRHGTATKVTNRRSHAWDNHDVRRRLMAKAALKYPPVALTGVQARSIAYGFDQVVRSSQYPIHACSILPEHVHLVIGRHHYSAEQIVRRLKQAAGKQLEKDGLHPFMGQVSRRSALPTPFSAKCWKCFIDDEPYLQQAIRYVENNPVKEGKKRQHWRFITPWSSRQV